jgi:hypothetical protein
VIIHLYTCRIWGSHSGCEEYWDITPCSPLKVNRRSEGTCRLQLETELGLLPVWPHFLDSLIFRPWKWRRCPSETSVHLQRTTRCYIFQDRTLHFYTFSIRVLWSPDYITRFINTAWKSFSREWTESRGWTRYFQLCMEPGSPLLMHKSTPLGTTHNHMNPVHTVSPYFCNTVTC